MTTNPLIHGPLSRVELLCELSSRLAWCSVRGDFSGEEPSILKQVVDGPATETNLAVDLTRCTSIDSAGVGVLIQLHRAMEQQGQRLMLVVPEGPIRKEFQRMGLDRVLAIVATTTDVNPALAG